MKPIVEAREYARKKEQLEQQRQKGNWCPSIATRETGQEEGFVCLRSPVREMFDEPCEVQDFEDCPFKKDAP